MCASPCSVLSKGAVLCTALHLCNELNKTTDEDNKPVSATRNQDENKCSLSRFLGAASCEPKGFLAMSYLYLNRSILYAAAALDTNLTCHVSQNTSIFSARCAAFIVGKSCSITPPRSELVQSFTFAKATVTL